MIYNKGNIIKIIETENNYIEIIFFIGVVLLFINSWYGENIIISGHIFLTIFNILLFLVELIVLLLFLIYFYLDFFNFVLFNKFIVINNISRYLEVYDGFFNTLEDMENIYGMIMREGREETGLLKPFLRLFASFYLLFYKGLSHKKEQIFFDNIKKINFVYAPLSCRFCFLFDNTNHLFAYLEIYLRNNKIKYYPIRSDKILIEVYKSLKKSNSNIKLKKVK